MTRQNWKTQMSLKKPWSIKRNPRKATRLAKTTANTFSPTRRFLENRQHSMVGVTKQSELTPPPPPHVTCPTRPEEPAGHNGPSATSRAAPRSGSTVWVWLSPQSSACFPGTLVETRDPSQTKNKVWGGGGLKQKQNK